MTTSPTLRFHDGNAIPQLGFGVFKVSNEDLSLIHISEPTRLL